MDSPLSERGKRELQLKEQLQVKEKEKVKVQVNKNAEPQLTPHVSSSVRYEYEDAPQWRKRTFDFIIWLLSMVFHCFFREIITRGSYKIPRDGPVIFVAAPHANQFVDPVILMDRVKATVNRRVSFLIAESSLKMKSVGFLARCLLAIGVVRPQDNLKFIEGKIKIDTENGNGDESSRKIIGIGTHFLRDCEPKGLIGLPKSLGNAVIESIESDTALTLRKEFKLHKPEAKLLLTRGTAFKYAHKVDQSAVYKKVFEHLAHDGCIGIFPEGGSHDRTDLLPLKAGVAIMALGCMDQHRDVNVKIVPCGMNYFHPNKFRSRAVVEFGDPIELSSELIDMYHNPATNKDAVKQLLDTITEGLKSVTVTCNDYETLMVVQAMRRLYSSQVNGGVLPLPVVVEMNRKLVKGYETYKNDPDVKQLKRDILKYNEHLKSYNIPDHQVETAKINPFKNIALLLFRSIRITISLILALPGLIMFSPVFILSHKISKDKAAKALANSTVKIKATDVIATWKILIAMGFAPLLYIFWSCLVAYYFRTQPFNKVIIFCVSYVCCVVITYSALIVGDIGMDVLKSLKPLYISIVTPNGLKSLQRERRLLTEKIVEIVDKFGSELFPGFDTQSLIDEVNEINKLENDDQEEGRGKGFKLRRRHGTRRKLAQEEKNLKREERDDDEEETDIHALESDAISLVNSDNSLSNIPLFSSASRLRAVSSGSSSFGFAMTDEDSTNLSSETEDVSDAHTHGKQNIMSTRIAQAVMERRNRDADDEK